MEFKISTTELKNKDPWSAFKASMVLYTGSSCSIHTAKSILFRVRDDETYPNLNYWHIVTLRKGSYLFGYHLNPDSQQMTCLIEHTFIDGEQVDILNQHHQDQIPDTLPVLSDQELEF